MWFEELFRLGTGMALAGDVAGDVEGTLLGPNSGCLRLASLPDGREARVGAGRTGLERAGGVESSKKGSKRLELLNLCGGDEASACEVGAGSGGDG